MAELDRQQVARFGLHMAIDQVGRGGEPAGHGLGQHGDQGPLAGGAAAVRRLGRLRLGQGRARRVEQLLAGQDHGGQTLQGVGRDEARIRG